MTSLPCMLTAAPLILPSDPSILYLPQIASGQGTHFMAKRGGCEDSLMIKALLCALLHGLND